MSQLSQLQEQLLAMRDEAYRDFQSSLIPGVEKDRIIGIRMPELRKFAKLFAKSPDAGTFLEVLPIGIMRKTIFI